MKTEIKDVTSIKKEISITVEASELQVLYGNAAATVAKNVTVPGFRKGVAPVSVVKTRYAEEIKGEVLRKVVPKGIDQAVAEHRLQTLGDPDVHFDNFDALKVDGSVDLHFHVHVEVVPVIEAPEYKGLEVDRRVRPTPEGQVDEIIDERRKQFASLNPVEGRPSKDGDTVIVDIVGTFEDGSQEPVSADGIEITLGDANIDKSFTENLTGLTVDEVKTFTVTYPEEFGSPALAGKTVTYVATVKSIGRTELPDLDDEWVKSLDEGIETVADLRRKIAKDIEVMAVADADARVGNDVVGKMIEKNQIEVPTFFVKNQANNLLNRFIEDLSGRGMDPSKIEKEFLQMVYHQMMGQAENDVRGALLLQKVAELENIEIGEPELADEILRLADYYKVSPDEIRASLVREGGEAELKNSLKTRKTIESIVSYAKVTEKPWEEEPSVSPEAEASEEKPKKAPKKAKSKDSEDGDKAGKVADEKKASGDKKPAAKKPAAKKPAKKADK
jgi:trigger factor